MKKFLSLILALVMLIGLFPQITFRVAAAVVNTPGWDTDGDGALEILAIGNSFSVDALSYAYQIAQDLGIEEIAIGNLYVGSCTLETHVTNAEGNLGKYTYYYNDNGTWTSTTDYKISTALESRSWDYISLQQQSGNSGIESSYDPYLGQLIAYVQDRSDAKLVWHMTWAYQQNATHRDFPKYNSDQMTMYKAIVSATQNKIATNSHFDLIVPNGTAVQNSRTSLLGDTTTRDGYHMSKDYGRYLTGLMFIKTITGLSLDDITYAPSGVDAKKMAIAIESVNNAAVSPYTVTESTYSDANQWEDYVLLQTEMYKGAYWHPSTKGRYNELIDDLSNCYRFFTTIRFTRETLPVGSVILLESGWQYRPDGWITDTLQTGTRESVTTAAYVEVTEEWWGQYTIRSFNVSRPDKGSVMDLTEEEMRSIFRIYVPKASHTHEYENDVCTLCGAEQPVPVIVTQPTDAEAAMGEHFCVTVEAEGEGLTYQWYFRNADSEVWHQSDITDKTYDDVMSTTINGREVHCVITDAYGTTVATDVVKLIAVPNAELMLLLQTEMYKGAYWHPSTKGRYNELIDDLSNCYRFFTTIRFTRETLPVGSVILLESGWQYRPDGWITDTLQTGTRESVTTTAYVEVTEEWWGQYTIRSFNVSRPDKGSVMDLTEEEMRSIFRIYVPKASHTHEYENDVCTLCGAEQPVPVIVTQPTDAEAAMGEHFCVTVEAEGEGLTYQWYFRNAGSDVWQKSGVLDNTYDDVMTTARAGREVYCIITDTYGNTVISDTAKLIGIPSEELEIVTQPTNAEAALGKYYCVTVTAKGEGLKYQWYFRNAGSDVWYKSSVTDNTYDNVMTSARAGREVYCVVTDACGNSVTTDVVTLIRIPVKLEIVAQPTDATAAFGELFCVTVKAQGEGLKYRWYLRNAGTDTWQQSGVRDNTYDDVMTKARNGREVYCVITDAYGNTVTTDVVKLIAAPKVELALLTQAANTYAAMGETYCVTVEAQGEGLKYQWYFRNAGSDQWYKSSVTDNTYNDVMTSVRAGREVYCVITDAYGNQIVTEVATLVLVN